MRPGRRAGGSLCLIHDGKRLRHDSRNRTRPPIAGRIRLFSGQENGTAARVVKEALRACRPARCPAFSQLVSESIAMAPFRIGFVPFPRLTQLDLTGPCEVRAT
jgi:hypothetical protein